MWYEIDITIDSHDYYEKINQFSPFCLSDVSVYGENIENDKNLVCGGFLEKCGEYNIDGYEYFDFTNQIFYGDINCSGKDLESEDLNVFLHIKEIYGFLDLSNNNFYNLQGLEQTYIIDEWINILNNDKLIDISGLKNINGDFDQIIYVDNKEYETKVDAGSNFCTNEWRVLNGFEFVDEWDDPYYMEENMEENMQNDMSILCNGQ